jgi:hypothetical protein
MTEQTDQSTNILKLKQKLEQELVNYNTVKMELRTIQNTINHLQQMICDICTHNWTIDSSSYNEHTEFTCTICEMTR